MTFGFLITTYGRQESCQRLVDSLKGLGEIIVLNDGADYHITGCTEIRQSRNLGKRGYWTTVNNLFLHRPDCDYYFMLPDDFEVRPNFIEETLRLWGEIKDPKKICLNLYADRIGLKCWTGFKPVDIFGVYWTQWVDMCFFCEPQFFQKLGMIPEIRLGWDRSPKISSGVGAYVSRHLNRKKLSLFQVKESIAYPIEEHYTTQMHRNYGTTWNRNPQGKGRIF